MSCGGRVLRGLVLLKALLTIPQGTNAPVGGLWGGAEAVAAQMGWLRAAAAVLFWLLASGVFYRIAVLSGRDYGIVVHSAVDLYRFELLAVLKVKMPSGPHEEKRLWSEFNRSFYESTILDVKYEVEGKVAEKVRPDTWREKLRALVGRLFRSTR